MQKNKPKKRIKEICKRLEKEKKVAILFAVENGSRAWGMESEDSDYDVRFVFVRPIKEYLQIHLPADVIEAAYNAEGKQIVQEGALIDAVGFDIFKFSRMIAASNPTTIEWLVTDIIYHGKRNKAFKTFVQENLNPIALYHHYKSMCRSNYIKYLKTSDDVTYKRYLYAFRGLINAKRVAERKTVPPIKFIEAVNGMKNQVPEHIINKIKELIQRKAQGKEKEHIQNISAVDQYIESFLKDDNDAPKEKAHATINELNREIQKIVLNSK